MNGGNNGSVYCASFPSEDWYACMDFIKSHAGFISGDTLYATGRAAPEYKEKIENYLNVR